MRVNKYIAQATGMSRRVADSVIAIGEVTVNGEIPEPGQDIKPSDKVLLDGRPITPDVNSTTIMLNKPIGYVCSRDGQGSKTVYDLLPTDLHHLKTVGRLDKDSSGLLLMTTNGALANELTHPRYIKEKVYEIELDKPLRPDDAVKIGQGVPVENYISHLRLSVLSNGHWRVAMTQGHNRQIRYTFAALGYRVTKLHRKQFGPYKLGKLELGEWSKTSDQSDT